MSSMRNVNVETPAAMAMRRELFRSQFSKTQICRFFAKGFCRNGSDCRFAHGSSDITIAPDLTKTSLCVRWLHRECPLSSDDCPFAHSHDELRFTRVFHKTSMCSQFLAGHCPQGAQCRHAHTVDELLITTEQAQIPDGRANGRFVDTTHRRRSQQQDNRMDALIDQQPQQQDKCWTQAPPMHEPLTPPPRMHRQLTEPMQRPYEEPGTPPMLKVGLPLIDLMSSHAASRQTTADCSSMSEGSMDSSYVFMEELDLPERQLIHIDARAATRPNYTPKLYQPVPFRTFTDDGFTSTFKIMVQDMGDAHRVEEMLKSAAPEFYED